MSATSSVGLKAAHQTVIQVQGSEADLSQHLNERGIPSKHETLAQR